MRLRVRLFAASVAAIGLGCNLADEPIDEVIPDEAETDGDGDGDGDGDDDGDGEAEPDPEPDPESDCLPNDEPRVGSLALDNNAGVEILRRVSVVDGSLGLYGGVTDISALSCLTEVTGSFYIVEIELSSLAPLTKLVKVGGGLEIDSSPSLVDVTLPELEHVHYLDVRDNVSLTNMEMPQLHIVLQNAAVEDNVELPTCDVTAIRDGLVNLGGVFSISNNLPDGCER